MGARGSGARPGGVGAVNISVSLASVGAMASLRLPISVLALALSVVVPGAARAQLDPAQADRALATFSTAELAALAPLLRTGTVSLVEFAAPDQLPAVVIATEVDADPATVAAVIGDPSHYPDFMPALDQVTMGARDGVSQSYEWAWQTSIFTLRGTNVMQTFAPPDGHPQPSWRFVVRSTGGDLGAGRTVWRVLPRPGGGGGRV
jgi:hypothetical protein